PLALHAFPTRRSSDLITRVVGGRAAHALVARPREGPDGRRLLVRAPARGARARGRGLLQRLAGGLLRGHRERGVDRLRPEPGQRDRKSTRLNSSHEWI